MLQWGLPNKENYVKGAQPGSLLIAHLWVFTRPQSPLFFWSAPRAPPLPTTSRCSVTLRQIRGKNTTRFILVPGGRHSFGQRRKTTSGRFRFRSAQPQTLHRFSLLNILDSGDPFAFPWKLRGRRLPNPREQQLKLYVADDLEVHCLLQETTTAAPFACLTMLFSFSLLFCPLRRLNKKRGYRVARIGDFSYFPGTNFLRL